MTLLYCLKSLWLTEMGLEPVLCPARVITKPSHFTQLTPLQTPTEHTIFEKSNEQREPLNVQSLPPPLKPWATLNPLPSATQRQAGEARSFMVARSRLRTKIWMRSTSLSTKWNKPILETTCWKSLFFDSQLNLNAMLRLGTHLPLTPSLSRPFKFVKKADPAEILPNTQRHQDESTMNYSFKILPRATRPIKIESPFTPTFWS